MISDVTICNMALSRCGVKQRITAIINPIGEEAKVCALWFEQCRDMALRDAPWGFANRIDALALLTSDAPPGWTYSYAYPADCLWARFITTESGCRIAGSYVYSYDDYVSGRPVLAPNFPFQVMAVNAAPPIATMIVTDLQDAYLSYVHRVEDPTLFDVLFVDYLVLLLALRIGPALRMSGPALREIRGEFVYTRSLAMAQSLNERVGDQKRESPSISYRG